MRSLVAPDSPTDPAGLRLITQSPSLQRVRSSLASPFSLSPRGYRLGRQPHIPRLRALGAGGVWSPSTTRLGVQSVTEDVDRRRRDAVAAATTAYERANLARLPDRVSQGANAGHGTGIGSGFGLRRRTRATDPVAWVPPLSRRPDRSVTQMVTPVEERILYYRRRERRSCRSPWASQTGGSQATSTSTNSGSGSQTGSIVTTKHKENQPADRRWNSAFSLVDSKTQPATRGIGRQYRPAGQAATVAPGPTSVRPPCFDSRTSTPGVCLPFGTTGRTAQSKSGFGAAVAAEVTNRPRSLFVLPQISIKKRAARAHLAGLSSPLSSPVATTAAVGGDLEERSSDEHGAAGESAARTGRWKTRVKNLFRRSMASISVVRPSSGSPKTLPVQHVEAARNHFGEDGYSSSLTSRLASGQSVQYCQRSSLESRSGSGSGSGSQFRLGRSDETAAVSAAGWRAARMGSGSTDRLTSGFRSRSRSRSQPQSRSRWRKCSFQSGRSDTASSKSRVTSWADSTTIDSFRSTSGSTVPSESSDQTVAASVLAGPLVSPIGPDLQPIAELADVADDQDQLGRAEVSVLTRALYRSLVNLGAASGRGAGTADDGGPVKAENEGDGPKDHPEHIFEPMPTGVYSPTRTLSRRFGRAGSRVGRADSGSGTAVVFDTCPVMSFSVGGRLSFPARPRRQDRTGSKMGSAESVAGPGSRSSGEWREWLSQEVCGLGSVSRVGFLAQEAFKLGESSRVGSVVVEDVSLVGRAITTPSDDERDLDEDDAGSETVLTLNPDETTILESTPTGDDGAAPLAGRSSACSSRTVSPPSMGNITIRRIRPRRPLSQLKQVHQPASPPPLPVLPSGSSTGTRTGGTTLSMARMLAAVGTELSLSSSASSLVSPSKLPSFPPKLSPLPSPASPKLASLPSSGRLTFRRSDNNLGPGAGRAGGNGQSRPGTSIGIRMDETLRMRMGQKENRPMSPGSPMWMMSGGAGGTWTNGRPVSSIGQTGGHKLATEFLNARRTMVGGTREWITGREWPAMAVRPVGRAGGDGGGEARAGVRAESPVFL